MGTNAHLRGGAIALVGLAATAGVCAAADAGGYTVRAMAYTMTSIDGFNADGTDSGELTQGNATAHATVDRAVGGRVASADADTIVAMGDLRFRLETSAYSPLANAFTMGHAEAIAEYTDIINIGSDTLPLGTPVVIQYRTVVGLNLNMHAASPGDPQPADLSPDVASVNYSLFGQSYAAGGSPIDTLSHYIGAGFDIFDPEYGDVTSTVNAEVGGTITIAASLSGVLTTRAGNPAAGFTHAVIDATPAARLGLLPVGEDAGDFYIYANSNAIYHLPEPGAAIAALPMLTLALRRRARAAAH